MSPTELTNASAVQSARLLMPWILILEDEREILFLQIQVDLPRRTFRSMLLKYQVFHYPIRSSLPLWTAKQPQQLVANPNLAALRSCSLWPSFFHCIIYPFFPLFQTPNYSWVRSLGLDLRIWDIEFINGNDTWKWYHMEGLRMEYDGDSPGKEYDHRIDEWIHIHSQCVC